MTKNVLLCGVGGQGTVLASRLIALAAMEKGMDARGAETIGMAQRGGSVVSHVRIGQDIYSPMIPHRGADVLICFEPAEGMAIKRHLALVNSTGIIDSDYYNNEDNEGHIMIALLNFGNEPVTLEKGERVAQGIFSKYLITNDDDATGVRTGGIGSTGTM